VRCERVIEETELRRYWRGGSPTDWADRVRALLNHQRRNWPRAREAFALLAAVQMRSFEVGGSTVRVQYNPGRFDNAITNVDPDHVRRRRCTLCPENRPSQQLGLPYEDYLVVVNPAPVFSEHLTIVHKEHRPQRLGDALPVMLRVAQDLAARYTVLYNGSGVGASAPDHLHLQLCRKGVLPIEHGSSRDWPAPPLFDEERLEVHRAVDSSRSVLRFRCDDTGRLIQALHTLVDILCPDGEAAVNVVCRYDSLPDGGAKSWTVLVFARSAHRPACYYAESAARMLISPGVIDMAGVVITPRREDFERVTADTLATILGEVSLNADAFDDVCARLARALQA
jgi:hypothetical protein